MAIKNRTIDFRQEGIRFVNYNPTIGTGVALTGATQTAFVATTPSFIITNNDQGAAFAGAGGETGLKNIYLDQLWLKVVAAGTGLTSLEAAIVIDTAARYSSGGTNVSANSVGTDLRDTKGVTTGSIALVYAGAITALAAVASRVTGRAAVDNVAPAVLDNYYLDFGEMSVSGVARAISFPMHEIVVAPGQSALIYLWAAGMTAAPTFEYGLSWIED